MSKASSTPSTAPDVREISRRQLLTGSAGVGLALAGLARGAPGAGLSSRGLHHPARARRVIFLCMAGGPSQFETLDEKPELGRRDGEPMPSSFTDGQPIAQLQGQSLKILGPRASFRSCGESGQRISDLLPFTQRIADRICIVRSMTTTQINHDPAHTLMNTGTAVPGRPSMGAWIDWGIGREASDLPGFVVMSSVGGRNPQPIASRQWHSGFLPGQHQGVEFASSGDPVHYVADPPGYDRRAQRDVVDAIVRLDRRRLAQTGDPEVRTRAAQYELAYRMQESIPELMDFSSEPRHVLDLYGVEGPDGSFAANCLVARRLAERGVRFIQLYHRGWDHHGDLDKHMRTCTGLCDRPSAALVEDLAQRGMLDDTLVVWGGEFGRTPMFQGNKGAAGRDHHSAAFSMWLAGGGVQGGLTYGETDELGYHVARDRVEVHDLHATMLHLLGVDHLRQTFRAGGRDHRLTDVHGHVVNGIIA